MGLVSTDTGTAIGQEQQEDRRTQRSTRSTKVHPNDLLSYASQEESGIYPLQLL